MYFSPRLEDIPYHRRNYAYVISAFVADWRRTINEPRF